MPDPRDPPRMVQAARFAESLLLDSEMAASFHDAFMLPPVMALNQFNKPGLAGALLAQAAKLLLDAPAPVSRAALNRILRPGRWIGNRHRRSALSDDEILSAIAPMGHVTQHVLDRPQRQSDGRRRPQLPRSRRGRPARGRRLDHAARAERQHQPHHHHGRGARCGPDPVRRLRAA